MLNRLFFLFVALKVVSCCLYFWFIELDCSKIAKLAVDGYDFFIQVAMIYVLAFVSNDQFFEFLARDF